MTMKSSSEAPDMRWKDLYRIGGISSIAVSILVLVAIVAFFIWPYTPLEKTTAEIFSVLQNDLLGGLISLDLLMLIISLINILPTLALYAALREVNESYALIALVLGLIAITTAIPARPLAEMAILSQKYAQAATETERALYLAAGETLRILFDGTAWTVLSLFFAISGLTNSILMVRSDVFDRRIAWMGIVTTGLGLGFFIPAIGLFLLFANTILTIPWYFLLGRAFIRLGWDR
jgi:hypothetical protein